MATNKERHLAEFLHNRLCPYNHIDVCGWYYLADDWTENSHKLYLKMAQRLLKVTNIHTIVTMIDIIKDPDV